MRHSIGGRGFALVLSCAIALSLWWLLTKIYPPLVVPTISGVAARLADILSGGDFLPVVWPTVARLLAGLAAGVALGGLLGAALGFFPRLHDVFRPLIGVVQSVPPVSWLVLALIWFGFNGRASVFIVAAATFPVMTMNMVEGVRNIDAKLLQMAGVYGFPFRKRLAHVVLPSILPYFRAGLHAVIGIGAKTVVMGEVLTASSGIGGEITDARLNLEPEGVVAWTIVLLVLYFLLDRIAALSLRGRNRGNGNVDNSKPVQTFWRARGLGATQPRG